MHDSSTADDFEGTVRHTNAYNKADDCPIDSDFSRPFYLWRAADQHDSDKHNHETYDAWF
ncbi:hypothetical protein [Corynebacterium urinipleomorphum]|uniref:hypothetical protein n=1 Tax=Corynebacterium urinipleomorphum TaxID=1852380 RepID=UPI000B350BA3|nr:hypothetical protein [Corynebacterium urinipleomorphum]